MLSAICRASHFWTSLRAAVRRGSLTKLPYAVLTVALGSSFPLPVSVVYWLTNSRICSLSDLTLKMMWTANLILTRPWKARQ